MKKDETLAESEDSKTTRSGGVISTDLLGCAECGAEAKVFCNIQTFTDRYQTRIPLSNKKSVTATCKRCGYKVAIVSCENIKHIREIWNIRIA